MPEKRQKMKTSFLLVLAMVAWGSNWVSAKILMNYFDAVNLIFWRFLLAAFGLVFIIILFKISFKISIKNLIISFVSAVFLILYNIFFFLGDHLASAALGGVLVTTLNPVVTFLIIALINKKNLTKKEIFALTLGAIGSVLIIEVWKFNLSINKGVLFFLLAAFTWPVLTLISSNIKKENSLVFSFYMFLFTAFISSFFIHKIEFFDFDLKIYFNLFALSLFGTSFATAAYFFGSSVLGGKKASVYIFIVPLTSVFFAYIFLKEKIDIFMITGGIISIIGVYILNGYEINLRKIFNAK